VSRPRPAERAERLRSPLLLALWVLLGFEAVTGLWLFTAFLVAGRRPGESIHVVAGVPLTAIYAVYQWRHWKRVAPLRARPDHVLGLVAATVTALTIATGLVLGVVWWKKLPYPTALTALHNIGSMLVLSFVGAHLAAVLMRLGATGDR